MSKGRAFSIITGSLPDSLTTTTNSFISPISKYSLSVLFRIIIIFNIITINKILLKKIINKILLNKIINKILLKIINKILLKIINKTIIKIINKIKLKIINKILLKKIINKIL
jgi:hypothetical protein